MDAPASDANGSKIEPSHGPVWKNRTVVGTGITSFLADIGYEMATAILPRFLQILVGSSAPVALGFIEGAADLLSNCVKLGSGWLGDRIGRRKPFVVLGYAITGFGTFLWAFAAGWWFIFLGKLLGWMGKGIRGPLRNAILADAVAPGDRGKAFGLHRAADTLGAVTGPLLAAWLLAYWQRNLSAADVPYRWVCGTSLIPGLLAALAFAVLVREVGGLKKSRQSLHGTLRGLPRGFWRYLAGVGIFGMGDFSRTLLILAATQIQVQNGASTEESAIRAALLYSWHNLCQALASYPAGMLSDRWGRRRVLTFGYLLGTLVSCALVGLFLLPEPGLFWLMIVFLFSGVYIAIEEALENAYTADLVTESSERGTAYGVLGTVNGFGDFLASVVVGLLWKEFGPVTAFAYSALTMGLGTLLLRFYR